MRARSRLSQTAYCVPIKTTKQGPASMKAANGAKYNFRKSLSVATCGLALALVTAVPQPGEARGPGPDRGAIETPPALPPDVSHREWSWVRRNCRTKSTEHQSCRGSETSYTVTKTCQVLQTIRFRGWRVELVWVWRVVSRDVKRCP